jgi:hypothetical protein
MQMRSKQILISVFYLISFYKTDAQIRWNACKKINWTDFKGSPPNISEFKANTFSSVECEYGNSDTCLFYSVQTFFHEEGSWYIDSTQELLEHERGHFNISEIYARKIRKYLRINLGKGISDDKINKAINLLQAEKNKYQGLYDKETDYSKKVIKQREWSSKINNQLKELDEYKVCEFNNCSLVDD